MNKKRTAVVLSMALATAGVGLLAARTSLRAADHTDGPGNVADPAADIGDIFAWMSPDGRRMNLALGIGGNPAAAGVSFSDAVQYAFHTTSKASYGATQSVTFDIICEFEVNQEIRCWAGNDIFMGGNAAVPGGIRSSDDRMRVATGSFNDPFFFNLAGFNATRTIVGTAAPSLPFDAGGCVRLDTATANALATQLRTSATGGPAPDGFGRNNQRFLVIEIDKSLLTRGGPIVGVWGSTHRS